MKIKSCVVATLLSLIISSPVLAAPKPDRCPSVDVIKYRGLLLAAKTSNYGFMAAQFDKYGTSAPWMFVMGNIDATDSSDAHNKGVELLTTLSGNPEPKNEEGNPVWMCEYQIGTDIAYAVSFPQDVNFFNSLKFKK